VPTVPSPPALPWKVHGVADIFRCTVDGSYRSGQVAWLTRRPHAGGGRGHVVLTVLGPAETCAIYTAILCQGGLLEPCGRGMACGMFHADLARYERGAITVRFSIRLRPELIWFVSVLAYALAGVLGAVARLADRTVFES
jgi:hypothetical protein